MLGICTYSNKENRLQNHQKKQFCFIVKGLVSITSSMKTVTDLHKKQAI